MEKFYELLKPASFVLPLIVTWLVGTQLFRFLKKDRNAVNMTAAPSRTRNDSLIAISIAAVFYLFAMWRLAEPPMAIFDECYHSRTAMEYLQGKNPTEWTHPPLAKLCMAVSLKVWKGDFETGEGVYKSDQPFPMRDVVGWRHASVLFGALSLLLLFALARAMSNSLAVAITAEILLALDGVFFVQSRVAMTNVFTVCFILLAALGAWRYHTRDRSKNNYHWLLVAGIGLGCAIATRWSSIYAWSLIVIFLAIFELTKIWRENRKTQIRTLGWFALSLVLIPVTLYALAYVPFVLQGPGSLTERLFSQNATGHGWGKVLTQQVDMWNYHTKLTAGHGYSSPWWSWPLVLRPTWYFFRISPHNQNIGIWCIGNFFLWWAVVPALVTAAWLAIRDRRSDFGMVALMGLGLWLMWGVQPRSLTFQHYFLEALPFGCLAVAWLGHYLWCQGDRQERRFVIGYATLCLLWFVYFYPLLSALPVSQPYYRSHLWLGQIWI